MKEGVKMVEKWKLALKEFLKKYEEDDDIIGAILCGSYATGNQDENSDINVYLILKNNIGYQEQGVTESNSYLIKYIIRNYTNSKQLMINEYENSDLITAHMIAYGKIIYDLEGVAKKIQNLAFEYLDKPMPGLTNEKLMMNNFNIWNYQEELKKLMKESSPEFYRVYYKLLDMILDAYHEFLEIPKISKSKVYKILTDETFKSKYHVFKLPEEEFVRLYLKCFEIEKLSMMYKNIESLINYYYKKQGGFNIRMFKLKSEL